MLNELSKIGKLHQSFQPLLKRCEKYGGVCLFKCFIHFGSDTSIRLRVDPFVDNSSKTGKKIHFKISHQRFHILYIGVEKYGEKIKKAILIIFLVI